MSKTYDPLLKRIFRQVGKVFLKALLQIEAAQVEVLPFEIPIIEDRSVDFLARVTTTDNKELIVHLEFQVTNHPRMHLRMLNYLVHIKSEISETVPVVQALIYFGKTRLTMKSQVTNASSCTPLSYKYPIVDLSQEPPQKYLDATAPEVFIFAVLTNTGDKTTEIMHEVLARLKTRVPPEKRTEMLLTLDFLTGLREDLKEIFKMEAKKMGLSVDVKKLASFEMGLEEGLKKGKKEGLKKGKKEGLKEGLKKGIVRALQIKFGHTTIEKRGLEAQIQCVDELASLEALFDLIEKAQTIEEIETFLEKTVSDRR